MRMRYIKNENPAVVSAGKCTGCGICAEVCPHGVFMISGGKASTPALKYCMGCGACVLNCPAKAISAGTGVGCAAAVINSFRKKGKNNSQCACTVEDNCQASSCCGNTEEVSARGNGQDCCSSGSRCC